MTRIPTLALAALLGFALPASAQTPQAKTPDPTTLRAPMAAASDEPDPAVLKAMKSQVFVLQHRDAGQLADILRPLGSGIKGARMSSTNAHGFNAISVRDFPENLAAIGAAIQRLDVPATVQAVPDVELHIQVLFASKQVVPEGDLPKDLESVVKSLRSTLGFRGYTLAASLSQRVCLNGDRSIQGRGQIEGNALGLGTPKEPRTLVFEWESDRGIALEGPADGPSSFAMRKFQFTLKDADTNRNLAELETGLTLKENEHVVVGTSVVKSHGVIVVISIRKAG